MRLPESEVGKAAFLPSAKTVYLIAGSEIGETALTSPVAKEIYGKITAVIDTYTNEEVKE